MCSVLRRRPLATSSVVRSKYEARSRGPGPAVDRVVGVEVEELHLRRGHEFVPPFPGRADGATQDLPGIALERESPDCLDVAEHARCRLLRVGPRQQLERGGVGPGQNVGLVDAAEPVYRGTVELHAPR